MGFYRAVGKRLFDFTMAAIGFVLFFPLILIIAILVRVFHGSPVLFTQIRVGLHEKNFKIYKFRTMTDDRDIAGNLLPDEDRMTKFGRFLRSTSLDELPELINILSGDMSVVGPRPLLVRYIPRYSPEQRRRHEVRPGLTGLAVVSGRNALSWQKRFKYDVYYVDHYDFLMDLSIIMKTLRNVIGREGISHVNNATMEEFMGN